MHEKLYNFNFLAFDFEMKGTEILMYILPTLL